MTNDGSNTLGYDAADQLLSTSNSASSAAYTYDGNGLRVEKAVTGGASTIYIFSGTKVIAEYDNVGRLTGTTAEYAFLSSTTFTNAYTYDANSNRTGYTAPDSSTNTYSYDTLNRLTTLASSWAGSFGYSYDALSRRTQMTRPNSVATNYTYDNLSRLTSVLHQLSGSTIDGAAYTLDSAGNRTAKTDEYGSVTSNYAYDAIYELTGVTQGSTTTESYTYDPTGNRAASLGVSSYTANSSNEMTANSNGSYAYDYNGNMTSKTISSNTTSYSWDYDDRLASVTLPGSGGTVTFKYDSFGRRVYKQSPTTTSIFVYDGNNLVETVNSSGSEVARYTQGSTIDEPLAMEQGSTIDYYEADGLGSITSLTATTGAVAQSYTYDSFGNTTSSTGSLTNLFRYAGREFDTETSLYFYRARYYDPIPGRFVSEDPIGFLGSGTNFFVYTANNPIRFKDPTGKILPLVLLLPAVGGLVNGIVDALNAGPCESKVGAFGRGFVSGAVGTLAGIGVGVLSGNPVLAGAAAGEISSIADQTLSGQPINVGSVVVSTVVGGAAGGVLGKLLPTHGRLPGLLRPINLGPNSSRMLGQELGGDALGGAAQGGLSPGKAGAGCGCK